MGIKDKIKEIKKYFPVIRVTEFKNEVEVLVYRGKKRLPLIINKDTMEIDFCLYKIDLEKFSNNFNEAYELYNANVLSLHNWWAVIRDFTISTLLKDSKCLE